MWVQISVPEMGTVMNWDLNLYWNLNLESMQWEQFLYSSM